jgi:hypothetical protein
VVHLLCRGGGDEIAWCVASCSCADCEWRPPMTVAEMRTARRCVVCEGAGDDSSSPELRGSGWFRLGCFPRSNRCSAHALYCDCENCYLASETTPIGVGFAVECVTPICGAAFHRDHAPHTGYCRDCADPEDLEGANSCVDSKRLSHAAPSKATITTWRRRFVAPTDGSRLSYDDMERTCLAALGARAVSKAMAPPSMAPPHHPLLY